MSDESRLEATILDLAAEIFQLKTSVASLANHNACISKLVNSLRATLSEKGLVSEFDLDAAIDLAEIEAVAETLPNTPFRFGNIDDEPSSH